MRRNWKRILSLLLTVAMIFTMNTSVFATEPGTIPEGDQATVEAAETTESTAAETVEETKETNSEATSETAEEPKAEETAATEEVVAETAPAATAETAVEETAAAEETTAATETKAVVEETEEVAPVEETVVEEAEAVVEKDEEIRKSETFVSVEEAAEILNKGWKISCGTESFIKDHVSINAAEGVVSVNSQTTTPIYLEPMTVDAKELKISGNGTKETEIEIVVSANDNIVHSVIISANCTGIKVKPGENVTAYYPIAEDKYAKVDENNGKNGEDSSEVRVLFAEADKAGNNIISLSNNGKDPKDIQSEVSINGKVWDYDDGKLLETGEGNKNFKLKDKVASANIVISSNDDKGVAKLYKTTVSAPATVGKPAISENRTYNSLTVSLNKSAEGYNYVFGISGDGVDKEIKFASKGVSGNGGTISYNFTDLSPETEYTAYVYIKGGWNGNQTVLLTDSALVASDKKSTLADETPTYYYFTDDGGNAISKAEKVYYFADKPETIAEISKNFALRVTKSQSAIDLGKDKQAEVTSWNFIKDGVTRSLSDNDIVGLASGNEITMIPVSANLAKGKILSSNASGAVTGITVKISANDPKITFTETPVQASANETVKKVIGKLEKALSVSFNGKKVEPLKENDGYKVDWFINGTPVSPNDVEEGAQNTIEETPFNLNVRVDPYEVSGNIVIKSNKKTVFEGDLNGAGGYLSVLQYIKDAPEAPDASVVTVSQPEINGTDITVSTDSSSQIDVIVYNNDVYRDDKTLSTNFGKEEAYACSTISKNTDFDYTYGSGTYTFYIRYAEFTGTGENYKIGPSRWTKIGSNYSVKATNGAPIVANILAKKYEAGTGSITVSVNEDAPQDIRYILVSENTTSASVSKNNYGLWTPATNGKITFTQFVSNNGWKDLKDGVTYWIYAAYFNGTTGEIDSPVSTDYKEVTTKKLGSIKSVTLKRDKDSITYEGLHSKLVSQNFTAEAKFDEDAYFNKDDVEVAIRMTLSSNENAENYKALMAAKKVSDLPDEDAIIDPTETSGNQVNAGKYIVRAFAEVKDDSENKGSYDSKYSAVSSNAVEFTIEKAKAHFVVSVNEFAGNVKNKQILRGKYFTYDENIKLSVYDEANKSYETLAYDGSPVYNITGSVGASTTVLKSDGEVSFNQAGTATFTLSAGSVTPNSDGTEVSANFTFGDPDSDTVEVVKFGEIKITATGTPLYYEAANKKDSFAVNEPGLYVKVTNDGDELTEAGYKNVTYTFKTVSDADGKLDTWDKTGKKDAGQKIWVSANFSLGDGSGDSKGSTGTAVVEVEKQPINVVFNGGEDETLAGQATRGTAKSELKSSDIKSVSVNVVTLKAGGKTLERDDDKNLMAGSQQVGKQDVSKIFKKSPVSLNFAKVNTEVAGTYKVTAQDLTPHDNISKNYVIASATGDFRINGKFSVKVIDTDTGAQYGDIYELSSVSSDLAIKLDKVPNKWYLKYTLGATTAETIDTLDDALGMTPASDNSGVYTIKFKEDNRKFKLEDYKGEHLVVYVSYAEDTAPVVSTGKNTPASYKVQYITPVVYTGEKHVASDDTKQASKKNTAADLNVVVTNGSEVLIPYVDYTISYKNNINAINSTTTAKKLPQVVIKGKGAHKGVQLTVNFSILPADFATIAEVSLKKPYFKLNGKTKANSLVTVVSKETGKKLKGKFNIVAYDMDDTEKKFTDSAKITDTVSAGAVKYYQVVAKNADLKKYPNYDANWTTYGDAEVIGIPVNSQTLKVGGTNKKIDYKEGITLNDLVGTKFKVTAKANKKIGNAKTEWASVADAQKAGVEFRFYDKNKKELSENGLGSITAAGTYYLGVGPKEDDILSLKAYGVYEPTYVKFTVKGTAIKSAFKLSTAKEAYDGKSKTVKIEAKKPAKVDVSIKSVSVDLFLPGSTSANYLGQLDKINADLDGSRTDLFVKAGTYTIRLTGQGIADGVQTLKYTVTPVKKATGVTAKLNNDKLSYNAAGYYKGDFEVTCGGLKLEEGVDYTVAYKVKKAAGSEGTYTITGTGTAFKGKVTGKFNVVACDLSAFEAEDTTGKTAQHNYYTGTASENNIKLYQANSTTKKELKAGVDYTISTNKVTKGSNDNFTGTLTVK